MGDFVDQGRREFLRGRFMPQETGIAVIDAGSCVAWDGSICMTCRLACGYMAISMDTRHRPTIDREKCNGCGDCVNPCPTSAIRVPQ